MPACTVCMCVLATPITDKKRNFASPGHERAVFSISSEGERVKREKTPQALVVMNAGTN